MAFYNVRTLFISLSISCHLSIFHPCEAARVSVMNAEIVNMTYFHNTRPIMVKILNGN